MKKIIEKIFEMNRFVKILIQLLVDGILISFSIFCATKAAAPAKGPPAKDNSDRLSLILGFTTT